MPTNNLTLRHAGDFYAIALQHDYTLTEEALESSVDKRTSKKGRWFYPDLSLLSFKDGTAEILNKSDKDFFTLYLKVEPEKLLVSCSCGIAVEKLCIHAYKALSRLIIFDDLHNLKRFMPNGAVQIVLDNSKYFELKTGLHNMFKPKPALGSVYGISDTLAGYSIEDVLALPASLPAKQPDKENTMCYIIMYSRRSGFLPFLLPCLGKLNKAGSNIKSFGNYLGGLQKEYDALLTEEQRILNNICLDLWKQVEKLPQDLIQEDMSYNETEGLVHVFELWQKAIPLLEQQHSYTHPYFQKRQLKGKPSQTWMTKIKIQKAVPLIEFTLTDKGAFYLLEMKPVINGKTIGKYEMPDTFFIKQGLNVYLLSSVRDAAVAEWMKKAGNKISIFKEQFAQFKISFLKPIERYYLVKEISNKK